MFTPSGDTTDETTYLIEKGNKWSDRVRSSNLSRDEVWYSLNHVIMKTIEYPLLSKTMTKKELDQVVAPILQIGLPRSGICRTISRELVYSSTKYQGLGLIHPFITQGIKKLLQLFDSSSPLSAGLISVAYHTTMIEAMLGSKFWEYPYEIMRNIVGRTWISTLWEFLDINAITLRHKVAGEDCVETDAYIMAKAIQHRVSDIHIFNLC
jgi:hypothetical protein